MVRSRRLAPVAGIVACLLVLGGLAIPYALTDSVTVGLYYGSGAVNPLVAGLLALLSIVVFAAGSEDRTDPALAAGVTLTFGLFMVVVTVVWAFTARVDIAGASLATYRWVMSVLTLAVPATAVWYARTLGLI